MLNTSRRAFVGVVRSDVGDDSALNSLSAAASSMGVDLGQWQHGERARGHVSIWYGSPEDHVSVRIASHASSTIDCFGYPVPTEAGSVTDTPLAGGSRARCGGEALCVEEGAIPAPQELDGPYVLVRVDGNGSEVTLFRDKFGQRQLYYLSESGRLWFSDNIRFLLAIRGTVQARPFGLIEWIHYGISLAPETLFEGVLSLPGGWKLSYNWENSRQETSEYFAPKRYVSPDAYHARQGESLSHLEEGLHESVARGISRGTKNQSAVSLLLSGGVDSSGVAAILARDIEVQALTVDMYGPNTESELCHAQKVASHLGIDLAVSRFGRQEFRENLCDYILTSGAPVIVPNAVALYHAAATGKLPPGQLLLDGEMADTHHLGTIRSYRYSVATQLVSSLTRIAPKYVRGFSEYGRRLLAKVGLSTRTTIDKKGLDISLAARGVVLDNRYQSLLDMFAHVERKSEQEICALTLRVFQEYLLVYLQRIDVMASVAESSVVLPFLLEDAFEYSVNVPMKYKIRLGMVRGGYHTKWLWKRVVSKLVPPEIVSRPKNGFGAPGGHWCDPMPAGWLKDSWVGHFFRIPDSELAPWWCGRRGSYDAMFFATMEIWGRLFVEGESFERVREQWLEADPTGGCCD